MTNTENQAGDVPDRVFEITPDRQLVRVRGDGSTIHSGMLLARVRSWFVDETDGLTTTERDYKSAVTERDEWKRRAEEAEETKQRGWDALTDEAKAHHKTHSYLDHWKQRAEAAEAVVCACFSHDPFAASETGADEVGHTLTMSDETRLSIMKILAQDLDGDV